jgi:hypothetical protein
VLPFIEDVLSQVRQVRFPLSSLTNRNSELPYLVRFRLSTQIARNILDQIQSPEDRGGGKNLSQDCRFGKRWEGHRDQQRQKGGRNPRYGWRNYVPKTPRTNRWVDGSFTTSSLTVPTFEMKSLDSLRQSVCNAAGNMTLKKVPDVPEFTSNFTGW